MSDAAERGKGTAAQARAQARQHGSSGGSGGTVGGVGEVKKLWLPVYGEGGQEAGMETGWVQVSLELVPEALAAVAAAGSGRSEPNAYPRLPPPVGRLQLSLNPFANCAALLGKEMCAKVSGFMCAMTCAVLLSWLFFSSLPVLFADLINPFD